MKKSDFLYSLISLLLTPLVLFYLVGPAGAQTSFQTYVVKRGDWLSTIAQRFGVSLSSLVSVNKLRNPDLIFVGQQLKIPERFVSASPKAYTVRWGDTLFSIAQRFKVSLATLLKLNSILNPNLVLPAKNLFFLGRRRLHRFCQPETFG